MNNNLVSSEGSFYIRKDTNSIYVQGTINGKHYKKSIGKKATPLAKKWMEKQNPMQVLLKLIGIKENESKKISFEEFGLRVIASGSHNRGKQTQQDYVTVFKKVILPYFKHFEFDEIKALDIKEFLITLPDRYCYDRCKRTKQILANIIETAHDEDIVIKNLMRTQLVQKFRFKRKPRQTKVYKVSEVKQMLIESKGWLKVFLELSIKYGLRTGELMGLKWSDFNLDRGFFVVNRSISKGEITESDVVVHENKNHLREIFLFPETISIILTYKNFRPDNEWLFVSKDGRPFKQSKTITDYHFKPFLNEIGVEYKTLYATRRTYVSMMRQSEKISLSDIQETVGHAKGSDITLEHYDLDCLDDIHKQKKALEKSEVFQMMLQIA